MERNIFQFIILILGPGLSLLATALSYASDCRDWATRSPSWHQSVSCCDVDLPILTPLGIPLPNYLFLCTNVNFRNQFGYGTHRACFNDAENAIAQTDHGETCAFGVWDRNCNDGESCPGSALLGGDPNECDSMATFYPDSDHDGYPTSYFYSGNTDLRITANTCAVIPGYVKLTSGKSGPQYDCYDNDANSRPGAAEICDFRDNDCNGQVDDGMESVTWYRDYDRDGFGRPQDSMQACAQPSHPNWNYVQNADDCASNLTGLVDTVGSIYPDAPELCDGRDNDCDGDVDEDFDLDGDGVTLCAGDCDDTNNASYPGATEDCDDGVDQNCDGIDLSCSEIDGDGDGSPLSMDCNDANASVYPNAVELCGDGIDQDCSGSDLSCLDVDNDGDGVTENEGDCNDADATLHLGNMEICGDGLDQDCDGQDEICSEPPATPDLPDGGNDDGGEIDPITSDESDDAEDTNDDMDFVPAPIDDDNDYDAEEGIVTTEVTETSDQDILIPGGDELPISVPELDPEESQAGRLTRGGGCAGCYLNSNTKNNDISPLILVISLLAVATINNNRSFPRGCRYC